MNVRPLPAPLAPAQIACKCCGSIATLFGVVDFNKSCHPSISNPLPITGIPIYYHRCGTCGFIFTIAFDHFEPKDFQAHIYNAGYAAVDPGYEVRPANNAAVIAKMFGNCGPIGLLDYGGGSGLLAEKLRAAGFSDVVTYDPIVPRFAELPRRKFDVIVSIEVVEHSHRPRETFAELDSLLHPDGIMLFSTLLQPADIAQVGMNWWYAAPRNGHVSLFTRDALAAVLGPRGFTVTSTSANSHFASRQGARWVVTP